MLVGQYVLLSLIVVFFVLTLRGRSKVERAHRVYFFAWVVLWVAGGVVVLFPESVSYVAALLGIGRGVDVVLYVGMMVVVYAVFRLMVRMYLIEREITNIVRHIALRDSESERGDDRSSS